MEIKKYDSKKIKEVLNEVRICSLLYCTKNGKVYSTSAEEYIEWLGQFAKYCIPEMANEWKNAIRKIIYSTVVPKPQYKNDPRVKEIIDNDEYVIIDKLYNFMDAAEIMKKYDETHSWECVEELVSNQGHSGWTFSGLSNVMIQYSLIGIDFIEKFDPSRTSRDQEFKKYYDQAQNYINTRQALNKRLVLSIYKKCN